MEELRRRAPASTALSDADGNCNAEIFVMRADGTSVTRLTNDPAQDAFADWQLEERRKR